MNLANYYFKADGLAAKIYLFYLRRLKKHPFSRKIKRFISKRFFPQGIRMQNQKGVKIAVSTFDYIDQEIIYKGCYEALSLAKADEILSNGGIFYDIGANAGLYSLHAAQQEKVRVFAFEPNPQAFVLLQRNISRNKLKNVQLFNIGLADRAELLGMSCPSVNNLGNYQITSENAEFYTWCMPLHDLENKLPKEEITLLKIDVEGFEWQVFQGINWETQKPRNILMEFLPAQLKQQGSSGAQCLDFLIQKAYSVKTVSGKPFENSGGEIPDNNLWFTLDE